MVGAVVVVQDDCCGVGDGVFEVVVEQILGVCFVFG